MKALVAVFSLILTCLIAPSSLAQAQESFTPQAREQKLADIESEMKESKKFALVNQAWDTEFKVPLLLLATAAAAGTAYVAAQPKEVTPPIGLKIFNAVSASLPQH